MPSEREWNDDRARFVADGRPAAAQNREPGSPLGPLAQQFATLTEKLLNATTVAGVLQQVVVATQTFVPGADVVSITLRGPDGVFHTPVETDPLASELDQLQYDTGEGPCVDAARDPGPAVALSDDLGADKQWPSYGPAAAKLGVGALLSTALLPAAGLPRLSGALNIYSRRPYGLDGDDRHIALLLATHASLALAQTNAVTYAELREAHLRKAVESRDVIGQAKGILMGRRRIDANAAFEILRRTSQELNVKLVDLARTLTARHAELDLPEPSQDR